MIKNIFLIIIVIINYTLNKIKFLCLKHIWITKLLQPHIIKM